MKKKAWKSRIKKACIEAQTYKPYFDFVIDELAGILERRDSAAEEYAEDPRPVVSFTNKNGAENTVKNPLLTLIDGMNSQALGYWRDLGLTPAGLRKINERTFKEKDSANSLIDRLKEMQQLKGGGDGIQGD